MDFIRFVFAFLFERNWHTGEMELSRPRMMLFSAGIFLILLGLLMVTILQAPVIYEA